MDLVAVEVLEVGMTVEEGLLATEAQGRKLELDGAVMQVRGMLTRAEAYQGYIDLGHSQRETAKYFGVNLKTVQNYLAVTNSVRQYKKEVEELIEKDEVSLRKVIAIGKPKPEPKEPKEDVIDTEVLTDEPKTEDKKYTVEEVRQMFKIDVEFKSMEEMAQWFLENCPDKEERGCYNTGTRVELEENEVLPPKRVKVQGIGFPYFDPYNPKSLEGFVKKVEQLGKELDAYKAEETETTNPEQHLLTASLMGVTAQASLADLKKLSKYYKSTAALGRALGYKDGTTVAKFLNKKQKMPSKTQTKVIELLTKHQGEGK